jgi:anti-sigma B factor antagonist
MQGELKLSPVLTVQCREIVAQLNRTDVAGLLIDMSAVTQIDSAGVGELVLICSAAAEKNRPVALAGARKRVLDVLRVVRIDSMFQIYGSETEGLEAMSQRS